MSQQNRKKIQKLRSQTDAVQYAMEEIPALKEIGREIKTHLDRLAISMRESFWVVWRDELKEIGIAYSDLNFEETTLWKELIEFLTNKNQNHFLASKLSLMDYLAVYQKEFFENKKKQEL